MQSNEAIDATEGDAGPQQHDVTADQPDEAEQLADSEPDPTPEELNPEETVVIDEEEDAWTMLGQKHKPLPMKAHWI